MITRIAFYAVLVIYGVLAVGLATVNWWPSGKFSDKYKEEAVIAHSKAPHSMRLFDSGTENFAARMELIDSAKKSLEVEFFIYHLDDLSRYFTQALVKQAQAGVKVRLLVDFSLPVLDLKPLYARYLKSKGIEVRYYNANSFYQIVTTMHRSHRKLLLVDGHTAMTGGRNIGDEYFDHDPEYNFLDTDVSVRGPLVQPILRSFNMYWESKFSEKPDDYDKPLSDEEKTEAKEKFDERPGDREARPKIIAAGRSASPASKEFICRDATFVTDFPRQGEDNRRVYKAIVEEVGHARESIVAESPYFVLRSEGFDVMKQLTAKGLRLRFLTNGLYSTDATYSVSALLFNLRRVAATGIELFAYDGSPTPGESYEGFTRTNRWGVHSKRAVIDGKTVLVGTYNIDPRSANLNSEMMLVCRDNPAMARAVLASIQARMGQSRQVVKDKTGDFKNLIAGGTWKQKIMVFLFLPLSNLFDFLL